MPRVGLVGSERFLHHNTNPFRLPVSGEALPFVEQVDHFSNPRLVERTAKLLSVTQAYEWLTPIAPFPASVEALAAYHTVEYIEFVRELCLAGGGETGQGAPVGRDSYDVAVLAAGGAIAAVDAVVADEVDTAFALLRPPGITR